MRTIFTLAFLISLLTGCSDQEAIENSFHLEVQTSKVKIAPFYSTYSGYGQISALKTTMLTAKFDGYFHLAAPEKQSYRKEEIIYRLTGPEVQLQKEILSSQRKEARADYDLQKELLQRKKDLQNKQFISVDEWEKLQRNYHVSFARFRKSDSLYNYFLSAINYRAPFDGYLTGLMVRQGDFIKKDQEVGAFLSVGALKLVGDIYLNSASLSRDSLYQITLNDSIHVQGRLLFLENSINPKTGGRKFWITLDSGNQKISNGEFVKYEIRFNLQRAPAVPESALIYEKKKYYLVTRKEKRYHNVAVKIGRRSANYVELVEGPPIVTEVVTRGVFEIFHRNLKNTLKIED